MPSGEDVSLLRRARWTTTRVNEKRGEGEKRQFREASDSFRIKLDDNDGDSGKYHTQPCNGTLPAQQPPFFGCDPLIGKHFSYLWQTWTLTSWNRPAR